MRIVDGENYYSPREIAEKGLITNSKGKPDYGYVLRLIKRGDLADAKVFNPNSQIPYYLVSEKEIERYNNRFKTSS